MKFQSAHVDHYKCINHSANIDLSSRVTCLVGKNESGKTAILEALYRLNPASAGHRHEFLELYDYPRRRRSADKAEIPKIQPVSATFWLEDGDVEALEGVFGKKTVADRTVHIAKTYENRRLWTIQFNDERIAKNWAQEAGIPHTGESAPKSVEELVAHLEEIEGLTERQQQVKQKASTDVQARARQILKPRLPKFLYFNNYNILPGRFSINWIQESGDDDLEPDERTALSLLRLAHVEETDFVESEYEARKAELEAASAQITDEVFEYWSQNKSLSVHFDIDFKSPEVESRKPPFIDLRIWNDRHRMSLNFDERSAGFVWFFSFLTYFSEFRHDKDKYILLLDEPGLGLHASAQGDLLRFIEERLAPVNQVIYTTHSPFLVDAKALDRVRTVEDREDEGTTVSKDVLSVGKDTLFPLQSALGYELSQTLFVGPNCLLVEGPSDIVYLNIVSSHLKEMGREGLHEDWVLVPAGGIDKIPTFVALLGTQLNVSVVLDVASSGNQKVNSLVKKGILEKNKVFPLTEYAGTKEADVEDMFEVAFYLDLLRDSGTAKVTLSKLGKGNRIIKRVEATLGSSFDHYRPAAYFQKEAATLLPTLSEESVKRFESLFQAINPTLEAAGP